MVGRFAAILCAAFLAFAVTAPAMAVEGVSERRDRQRREALEAGPKGDKELADKNYDKAIEYFTKVIDSRAIEGEELGKYYFKRGIAYQAKTDCANAVVDYDHAAETLTTNGELLFNRSLCHDQLKQPEKAAADLDAAIKLNPEAIKYRVARCITLFNAKNFAGALPDCELALTAAPDDQNMLSAVSQASEQLGNKARAAAAYKHWLELDPNNQVAKDGLKRTGG